MTTLYSNEVATQTQDVGIGTFLGTIFHELPIDARICLSLSGSDGTFASYPATERRIKRFKSGTAPWYFCISSVAPPTESGYLARTHKALRSCYCLALDDIGTAKGSKALTPPIEPHWKLESSKDNFQWGYLLEPIELTPENTAYVEACIRGLAIAGYSDPGARGAYRIMRVPGSLHKTGFVSRVTEWNAGERWKLSDLMSALNVEPAEKRVRPVSLRPGSGVSLDDVNDYVYRLLCKWGMVLGSGSEWVYIECPWGHEHTTESPTGTSYSPLGYGSSYGRAFSCLHSHGDKYRTRQFIEWVEDRARAEGEELPKEGFVLYGAKLKNN